MSALDYRAIFISDVHWGSRDSRTEYLRDFLANTPCRYLCLVGDIVDLWKMRGGIYWPQIHSEILKAIMCKACSGTRVVYIPGNHDELRRDYVGTDVCGISVRHQAVHRTADRRQFLVTHGDEFDGLGRHNSWLRLVGEGSYGLIRRLNRWFGYLRRRLGFPYWSLSTFLKSRVKNALEYLSKFETAARRPAPGHGWFHLRPRPPAGYRLRKRYQVREPG